MEVSRLIRDGTAEPFSRDQIFRREGDREIVIFPVPGGCFDVYFICAHFPETDARCSCSRALPLPAAGCLNGPRSLSPGFTHYVRFCRFAECAEGSADWLKCSTRTVQAPTGGTTPVYVPVRCCLQSGDDSPAAEHGPSFAASRHHSRRRMHPQSPSIQM